ncbi:MAG: DUF1844 domain-containing protein [Armatimonadota bacterium]|nr:DUF1844 domain-containing protein [Armatimonadota bacterium]
MAEEEATFTFVDKRRAQAETPAETPAADPEPSPAMAFENSSEIDSSDAEFSEGEMGGMPGTYDLIGYCLNLLASQAWQKLGLLADPQTGEAKPDLVEAKVAIDAVCDLAARLESAPEAVIPGDMRRDLRTLLNDLRLNYVSQRDRAA